jgi:putative sigma-54 modulation protein
MIELSLSGNNYELNEKIREYVEEKIGELDKYVPRTKRDGLMAKITLTLDESGREDNQCICEATIQLPGVMVEAREATLNMFAAVDIVEAKLKAQVLKYKTKHSPKQNRAKRFIAKIRGTGVEQ